MKVIVVGAGVIGCAIAHALASRGAQVRVVDPRGTGLGATRASAGILAPHIEGHVLPLLTLGLRSLAMYDEFIRRVTADARQPLEYERSGSIQIALNRAEAAELCASARALGERDIEHAFMDAPGARRLEPALSADVVAALLVPMHGYVAAASLTRALAQGASNLGAIVSAARVLAVEGGSSPHVRTTAGTLDADAVIVAAGSWSPHVVCQDALHATVKPIRGQLVHVRLVHRPASRVIWGTGCYLVPWRDGSVLVGATVEDVGFDETATADGVKSLLAAGMQLMPMLVGAAFEEVRVGLRPMTRDELPAIGRSSTMPNVFYATGHYRNGVLLAPLTASLVADLVLDGREGAELALVRPDRLGM